MRTVALSALAAAASAAVVQTPGGRLLDEACVKNAGGRVVDLDTLERCGSPSLHHNVPNRVQTYAMSTNSGGSGVEMTQMNTSWNVPSLPVERLGQVVYFWPGFKSDAPKMGLPVLQPVLQYGQHSASWELQSWFVDGDIGQALTGPLISDVQSGDEITSFMSFDNTTSVWTCSCTIKRTGETSVLQLRSSRIRDVKFHYSMLVLETIMPTESCKLYPRSDAKVEFTNVIVNNKPAKWDNTVYTQHQCDQHLEVHSDGSATLSWHN